jgi:hypothetical protein
MSVPSATQGCVFRVDTCELSLGKRQWDYARVNADAIAAHWDLRRRSNPGYFNGSIHLMERYEIIGSALVATFFRTDFKSFLYWREHGYPAAEAFDAFGSALIRSAEGHVLLGRQSVGNINAGLCYLPGGFIDERDVAPDGRIVIGDSIAREVAEETGLTAFEGAQIPGFLIVRIGALVSMIREFRCRVPAVDLRAQILARLATETNPELADIVIMRRMADLVHKQVPPYTAMALATVLPD